VFAVPLHALAPLDTGHHALHQRKWAQDKTQFMTKMNVVPQTFKGVGLPYLQVDSTTLTHFLERWTLHRGC
jgi:hypothetical protein